MIYKATLRHPNTVLTHIEGEDLDEVVNDALDKAQELGAATITLETAKGWFATITLCDRSVLIKDLVGYGWNLAKTLGFRQKVNILEEPSLTEDVRQIT